ncbi:AvrD family protein [Xenorhabdus sp. TH1]|uniref:AvrD family protein n=1 Tax=Xenorhabdus sp. TH1 TaxID=3130166 RepID=UPI0030CED745
MNLSYYKEIDEFLGVRNSRYFGDGYLRTNQSVINFRLLEGADHLRFICTGQVFLPDVWSQKGKNHQTPHLSTIDVIELSIECLRQLLANTLQNNIIRNGSIRTLSIIAGNKPVETSLDNIEISGKATKDSNGNYVLELAIANMMLEIVYVSTTNAGLPVLSPGKQPVEVSSVMIHSDDEESTASAIVTPLAVCTNETWSVSSCFAASLQLGQTLLYNLDKVDRAKSNTLWMKRTTITFSQELSRSTQLSQPIFTKLENVKKYTKADGDWRRADIVSVICNAKIVCSVTHRLPTKQQQELN